MLNTVQTKNPITATFSAAFAFLGYILFHAKYNVSPITGIKKHKTFIPVLGSSSSLVFVVFSTVAFLIVFSLPTVFTACFPHTLILHIMKNIHTSYT